MTPGTNDLSSPASSRISEDTRVDILGLSRAQLTERISGLTDRRYRADQIFDHVYRQGVVDFDAMTDLSLGLRRSLGESFRVGIPPIVERHRSSDGTEKVLLALGDGVKIETVDIPDGSRRTLCLSSQAGCALGCAFCVTGYWGGGRNLTAGEIVGQVLALRRPESKSLAGVNLVFMGMGEPLLNVGALEAALEILTEYVSWRRITVSTVGILPALERMAAWRRRPNLAVSLHAPDDERRSRIMPINRIYPLTELVAALRRFPLEGPRRITLEYVMIREFNDAVEDADRLASVFSGMPVKANLIPINEDPVLGERMKPPARQVVDAFRNRLRARGMTTTVRRRRGDDVDAACGQLRSREREPRVRVRRLGL